MNEATRFTDQGESADAALAHAAGHQSQFMWPCEEPPHGVARGTLDDETCDGLAVLRGTAPTGSSAVVVGEDTLQQANWLAHESTTIQPSHTSSAGVRGLLQLQRQGVVAPGARVGVSLTGVQR
jgi:threonine synthase